MENNTFPNIQTVLETNLTEDTYGNSVLRMSRHIALATLSLAIIINMIVCVIILTDKALKTNHQRTTFLAISIDEIIVELMLTLLLLWKEGGIWCDIFLNVFMICRLTTYSLLLHLCLERLLAVYPNKKILFQKFRSQNGRLLYLTASLLLASMIFIPISVSSTNGIEEPNLKGGCKSLSYNTLTNVSRFLLATYSVIILGIYGFLVRKIKNQHKRFSSKQSMEQLQKINETANFVTTVKKQPNLSMKQTTSNSAIPTSEAVFSIANIQKQENFQTLSGTSNKIGSLLEVVRSTMNSNQNRSSNQRGWQKRANRVLRNAILSITVPSILQVGLQTSLMVLPGGDTRPVEVAFVSLLSAFSPAILYPFMFIFSVKSCVCCSPRKT